MSEQGDAGRQPGRSRTVMGTVVFFAVAPGSIAGWIPYALSRWRMRPPLFGWPVVRVIGAIVIVAGVAVLVECFRRFVVDGRGTPAPIAPPDRLVVSGLYRYVRNPMYVAIVAILAGQALLLGAVVLFQYLAAAWLVFHAWVLMYEEPTLEHTFGDSFRAYRAAVPRWIPRLTAWRQA